MDKKTLEIENEKILAGNKPDNYLAFAIICTLTCFTPVGVLALFSSLKVNQLWEKNEYAKARKFSVITRILCLITVFFGIIFWLGITSGAFINIYNDIMK